MQAISHPLDALQRLLMNRRFLMVLTGLLAVTLIAAACGGDDDDDEQDQTTPPTVADPVDEPDAAGGPLKIAFLADFSGPLAEFGPVIQTGVELALQHVNDAGGVLGQDVELVTGDTGLDPTQGVEEARRLVDIEGVHGIIGPLSSTITLAVSSSVTADAGIPTISPSATSPALSSAEDNGYLFRSTISDAAQGVILAQLAADEGIGNVGVLFINDAYGQGLAESFEAAYGGTVTASSYEDGAASYLAELQSVAEAGADTLIAIGFPTQAKIYIREALENDIFDEFLFVDGTKSQELIDDIGDTLDGSKGTAPGSAPVPSDAAVAWNDAYEGEFGELPTLPFVREAYDGVIALALAAEAAGSTDGEAIRDQLAAVAAPGGERFIPGADGIAGALAAVRNGDDINYDGVATTLDWDANGDVTTGFVEIWQYESGEIISLDQIPFSLGGDVTVAVPVSNPLKIAFLADFSGPLAEFGPVIQTGVELALKHINDAGGVLGNPVELVTGDTGLDPTQGVEEARRLVDIEGVDAIVGPLSSTITLAVTASVTADAGVPTISPSATSPALSSADDNGFLFRTTISDAAQGVILAQLATDEGIDDVGVLFINDAYGQGLAESFENAFGGTVTSSSYEDGAASYLAELQSVAGADTLIAIGFPTQAQIYIREALENDIFSQFLFVDGTKSQDLIDDIGDSLNGSKGTAPGAAPVPSDAAVAWNAAYLAEFGELPTLPFVREAYDAVIAIALAAEFAGSTDGDDIRDALSQIGAPGGDRFIPGPDGIAAALAAVAAGNDINYDGVATTVDWDENGDVTTGFVEIWQYEGGEIISLDQIPFSLE